MSKIKLSPSTYESFTKALNTDSTDITYSDIKSFGDKGFRNMNILWKGKQIRLQARSLITPFGVDKQFEESTQRTIQFDLPNLDEATEHDKSAKDVFKLKQLYIALEDKLKRDADKNQSLWLNQKGNKKFTKEVIDDKFGGIVKEHPEGKFHDKFKVKLPYKFKKDDDSSEKEPKFVIYDIDEEIIEYSDLTEVLSRKTKCNVTIYMSVWFTGGRFGLTQNMEHIVIVEKQEEEKPIVFDNSDDEDEDDNVVEDSDDEDSD